MDWIKSGGKKTRFEIRHENRSVVQCESRLIKCGLTVFSFMPSQSGLYFIDVFIDDVKLPGKFLIIIMWNLF